MSKLGEAQGLLEKSQADHEAEIACLSASLKNKNDFMLLVADIIYNIYHSSPVANHPKVAISLTAEDIEWVKVNDFDTLDRVSLCDLLQSLSSDLAKNKEELRQAKNQAEKIERVLCWALGNLPPKRGAVVSGSELLATRGGRFLSDNRRFVRVEPGQFEAGAPGPSPG